MQQTTERLGGVGRPDYLADRSGYNPAQARREELRSEAEIARTGASGGIMTADAWKKLGASYFTSIIAGGVPEGFPARQADYIGMNIMGVRPHGLMNTEASERETIVDIMMAQRASGLRDTATSRGLTYESEGRTLFTSEDAQEIYDQILHHASRVSTINTDTIQSYQEPAALLERLESIVDNTATAADSNERIADNSGEANTGMHD